MDLEQRLLDAAESLVLAAQLRADGYTRNVASMAVDAEEAVLRTSISIPNEVFRGGSKTIYPYVYAEAERIFGIDPDLLTELKNLRNKDRFSEARQGKEPIRISEAEVESALQNAKGVILTVLGTVAPLTALAVKERLRLIEEPTPEEILVERLEHDVGWGHYDPKLAAQLLSLETRLRARGSVRGRDRHVQTVTLRAHLGMNQSQHGGPEGAMALSNRALEFWKRRQNVNRTIHTLSILSICFRNQGHPERAVPLIDEAAEYAKLEPPQMDRVLVERAAILMAQGQTELATGILEDQYQKSKAKGDLPRVGRILEKLGKCAAADGRLAEAEVMLNQAQQLIPQGYIIAQCVAANALAEFYALVDNRAEAHRWAERVAALANENGFAHQLDMLEHTLKKYPKVW